MARLPRSRKVRMFVVSLAMLLAILSAVVLGVSHSTPAHAGSNGQQVIFTCWALGATTISGTNQNGNYVTWRGDGNGGGWVGTNGWWWVGTVTIGYYSFWNYHTKTASVPMQKVGDWYTIGC